MTESHTSKGASHFTKTVCNASVIGARKLLTLACTCIDIDDVGEEAMKVKPLGDRIVIRRDSAQEATQGGIVLPESAKNKPQRGTILAVGPGKLLKDGSRRGLQVKEGDSVLFTSWAGDEFKDRAAGGEILVMREEDVLAVLE